MLRSSALYAVLLLLTASCFADQYYFETVSYDIQTSAAQTRSSCHLQMVSLRPDLSSLRITLPYSLEELSSATVLVGKNVVQPEIHESGNVSVLRIGFSAMKVGEVRDITIKYATRGGVDLRPGARVEVRTLGLDENITAQAMNLELPKGLTVASIETPYGVVKAGRSGGIPLIMEKKPTKLIFVIRRLTLLDNRYFVWGTALVLIALPLTWILYRKYRRGPSGQEKKSI